MSNKDLILRATSSRSPMRFVVVDLTKVATEIGQRHGARAFALSLLGESAIASLILSSGLKFPGTVSLRVDFSGDISFVQAESTPSGLVRAMILQEELSQTKDFELLLSPQFLRTRKLDERARLVSESTVETAADNMGQNLALYMMQSEQTRCATGILARPNAQDPSLLDFAVGFLVEAFPDASTADLLVWEEVVRTLPPLESFFDGEHYRLRNLLDQLGGPHSVHIVKELEPQFHCPCSKVRTLDTLAAFSDTELRGLLLDDKEIELVCDFCRNRYEISAQEIEHLIRTRPDKPDSKTGRN